jgi:sulfate-transporting ATPase
MSKGSAVCFRGGASGKWGAYDTRPPPVRASRDVAILFRLMSEKIVFHLNELRKYYGQKEVLKGITLSFLEDAKIGLIGLNGAGKSTLLRIISGEDQDFEGEAQAIAGTTTGYLSQEPHLNEEKTVAENVEEAVQHLRDKEARYYEVMNLIGEAEGDKARKLSEEYDHLQHEMDAKDIWNLDSWLEQAKSALVLPPDDQPVKTLSGGERRRIALCKLLIEQPDILLLDEPTNHLDADTVQWLETHLAEYPGLVILITHDRYVLDNVVGWMLEIERGKAHPYKGNYSDYLVAKEKILDVKRQSDSRASKLIKNEKEWLGRSPAARTSHNKARVQRYKEMVELRKEDAVDELDLRIPPGGSSNERSSKSTRSPNAFRRPRTSSTRSPSRGPGGIRSSRESSWSSALASTSSL